MFIRSISIFLLQVTNLFAPESVEEDLHNGITQRAIGQPRTDLVAEVHLNILYFYEYFKKQSSSIGLID